jgi:hypothetical protein
VTSLTAAGNAVLIAGGSTLAYANMASFGFQAPSGGAGLSMDAVGKTGTQVGGQVVLITQSGANTGGAVVTTDKDDYAPGTPVIVTGSGFGANESVALVFHEDPTLEPDFTHTATADANGAFTYSGFSPDTFDVDVRFILKATGQTSGRTAQTTFTDGNVQTLTLSPSSVTVSAGNAAVYPLTLSFNGNAGNCTVTLSVSTALPAGASASFSSNPVTASGGATPISTLTISTSAATPAGSYPFTVSSASGANCQNQNNNPTVSGTLVVTAVVKQNQTINFVAISDAVFGDTPTASASASSGLPVTLSSTTSTVCSITGVTITLNSIGTCTIQAAQAGDANYNPATSVSRSFNVAAKALTVSGITANNKSYDGTTAATLVTSGASLVGAGSGVTLNSAGAVGTFADKNVGTAKTVTITGLTLSGSSAGNYTLSQPTTTANITAKSLTATVVAQNKQYDGGTTATVTPTLGAGVVSGDLVDVAASAANFDTKAVGNGKTVTATLSLTGAGATNYALSSTTATTTANITPKALTGTIAASDKAYDGTTAATVTASLTAGGVISPDVVTVAASGALFDTKAVGTAKTVTANLAISGADAGNYTINATATTTANITAKQLTATATAQNKIYDATTTAVVNVSLGSPSGVIAGDVASVSASAANFADKNVGNGKTVTVTVALSGADATNYSLASTSLSTTANITAKSTTISITAQDKEYDGTAAATAAGTSSATIAGDVVTVSVTNAAFNNKSVGNGKPVTATVALAGADAGNYAPTSTSASTTASITPKALSVGSVTVNDKIYDGTTAATIATRTLAPGAIAGDDVSLTSGTATFGDKNVGTNKPVSVTGLTLGGTDAGNYTLGATVPPVTASITPKAITGSSITAANKEYDGTNAATVTPLLGTGAVSGDAVALAATGTFADKNVGTGKTVTASLSLTGGDAGNYTLNGVTTATATANITAKALVGTFTANDKVYDGNTSATTASSSLPGVISPDAVTLTVAPPTFDTKNVGTGKTVTAALSLSGADAGNYSVNGTATTTAAITALAITGSITADNKVYDGTTAATIATRTLAGKVSGDAVAYSGGTATFADKNVGTGKTVSATGLGLSGADAGNYTVNTTATTTADITARSLVVTAVAQNKVYDGSTSATVTLSDDRVSGDVFTVSSTSATFSDKNVANGKTVTVSGISLAGADAGNYSQNATATTTANITALGITGNITASDKVYDGTTAATIATRSLSGVIGSDNVTYTGGSATFSDKNVGAGKTVSATGLSLSGTDAGNYTVNAAATTTASITARALLVSAAGVNKVYDGTTTATVTLSDNRVSGDVLTSAYTTAAFADKNVGTTKAVWVSGISISGTDAGNYTANTTASTTADITALGITGSITASNKVYDGTTTAAIVTRTLSGQVSTDNVSYTGGTATFANKNVGTGKTVTGTGLSLAGPDAPNYTVNTTASTTADITARVLVIGATGVDKVYDGTVTATVNLTDNRVAGDALTTAYTTAAFVDKNVGGAKPVSVSGISISGADAGNYSANTSATTTAAITPKTLVISATASNKTYDGTTSATATLSDDRIAGDAFTTAFTSATFNNKNVGSGKTVTVSGISVSGSDAGNYTANTTATATADITARTLLISAAGVNKVYDGNATATVTLSDNRVPGDVFSSAYSSATFSDKNAGVGKSVGVSGISISGTDAGNYSANTTASTTANITARPLAVTAAASDKVYDGNTSASVTLSDDRVAGDQLTISTTSATFSDKNVGNGKTVTVNGISISNTDAGNYTVNTSTTATASITALAITGSITASNKVYDGTTAATIATRTLSGQVSGDNVSYTGGTATFADKNVGTSKTVTATGLGLGGTDAGNYTVNTTATTTANITVRTLVVTAAAQNKVYDGNTSATVTLSDDRVSGDVFTVSSTSAVFSDKNVANGKTVTVSGISLAGADAGNYSQNTTATTTANITALGITGSITANSKVYDGSTSAVIATRTLNGQVSGDNVSYTGGTATFANKNVGTGKTVTGTGLSLAGTDAGNYTVNTTAATTADITPRTLVISAAGINKIYDNSTTATVTLSDDRVSGDLLNTTYGSATFASANVGSGIVVTVSGIAVTGTDAGNYSANTTASTTASITQRPITFKADDKSAVWSGAVLSPSFTFNHVSGGTSMGYASGESASTFTAPGYSTTPSTVQNVGAYAIVLGGLANANYAVTRQNGTLTVLDQTSPTSNITQLNPVPLNTAATLIANLSDVATGNSNIVAWKVGYDGVYDAPISLSGGPAQTVTKALKTFSSTDVVQVCVQSQDAGLNWSAPSCALLAIYDPSTGFVTGGGWIDSPAGAYRADLTLTGKANFGFVSKYQKGATVPSGNTEFQFKEGNLNFSSTNFQWLVIQGGTMAQFKGTGTINGVGNYNFLVTANDGDVGGVKKPDSFRIKITQGTTVVYDNKYGVDETLPDATVLGGGSIQIQAK